MKKIKSFIRSFKVLDLTILTMVVCIAFFACQSKERNIQVETYETKINEQNIETNVDETNVDETNATVVYDVLDLEPEYDDYAAIKINFDEKNVPDGAESVVSEDAENVILKSGGIYALKGTLRDKRIKVEKGMGERIEIVLDGFKYEGEMDCPIYSPDKECRVLVFLAGGSDNVINLNKKNYKGVVNENSAVFSSGDLSFNGKGKLTINTEFESSIECKNNLTFIDGNYIFNSKGDAIRSKEKILIRNGDFNIKSTDDGIKATSEKKGYIYLENGIIDIQSGDKGVSSDNELYIVGGNISIDSKGEGIGGKIVDISGGVIKLKSGDDGINANDNNQNKKSNQTGVYVRISGGQLDIDAAMDGIDSNGDLYFDGGNTVICGSDNDNERIIDYNGVVTLNRGTILMGAGPGARMQDFGDSANQNYIVMYFNGNVAALTSIDIKDETGKAVLLYAPQKDYKAVLLTSPELIAGKTYAVRIGGKEYKVELKEGRNVITE